MLIPSQTKLQIHPGPKNGLLASCSLQAASHTVGVRWLMDHPTLLGIAGAKGFPFPKNFKGAQDY